MRRAYDFDAAQFVADYGSEHWQSVMGVKKDPPAEAAPVPKEGD